MDIIILRHLQKVLQMLTKLSFTLLKKSNKESNHKIYHPEQTNFSLVIRLITKSHQKIKFVFQYIIHFKSSSLCPELKLESGRFLLFKYWQSVSKFIDKSL